MPRASTLDPRLKDWLNHVAYPKLSHDRVFGTLPNYQKAQYSETRYADCPRCHRHGTFYMLPERNVGRCSSCTVVIAWFAYLKFDHTEAEAIETIARLAGVEPFTPSDPDPEPHPTCLFRT